VTTTLEALDLPNREALAFFLQKTNADSAHWTDVWEAAHSRSFMVAGAAGDGLLNDFRGAIGQALQDGTTLADFRRDFDNIVARNGWVHNGTPAWRARIIYETNLSTAYSAGRYAQQTEPDTLAVYPFWQYVHSGSAHPRLQHRAWNGLTLRADDGWWKTHYPPNGWNCGCYVRPVSGRGMSRMGKAAPDTAPAVTFRDWTNPKTGQVMQVPNGVDPGFGYNPGEAWRGTMAFPADAVTHIPPAPPPPVRVALPRAAQPAPATMPVAKADDLVTVPVPETRPVEGSGLPPQAEPAAGEAEALRRFRLRPGRRGRAADAPPPPGESGFAMPGTGSGDLTRMRLPDAEAAPKRKRRKRT